MRKTNRHSEKNQIHACGKKGFTLVELLVVISIISTLATVVIMGYKGFTEKAKTSNDNDLTIEINTILQGEEALNGKNDTAHDATEDLYDNGISETDLNPISAGYHFIWDSNIDRFALIDDKEEVVAPNDYVLPSRKYTCFEFVDSDAYSAADQSFQDNFSHYLIGDWSDITDIVTSTGIDVGDTEAITDIVYINDDDSEKNVIIRTDSIRTDIGINTIGAITLYGEAGKIVGESNNIIDYTIGATISNPALYITDGTTIAYLKLANGYAVIEKEVYIILLYATSDEVKVSSEGTICHAHTTDETTAKALNSEGITDGFIYDYDDNESQVEEKGDSVTDHSNDASYNPDQDSTVKEAISKGEVQPQEKENEESISPLFNKNTNTYYSDLSDAFNTLPDNQEQTIILMKDISIVINNALEIDKNKVLVLELNGHVLNMNFESENPTDCIINNGTLTIKDDSDTNKDGSGKGAIISYTVHSDDSDEPKYTTDTIENYGLLTIESGLIENKSIGKACYAIDSDNSNGPVRFVMNGGKILQGNSDQYALRIFGYSSTDMNETILNGGIIEGGYGLWMYTFNNSGRSSLASLTINDGKLISYDGNSLYIGAIGTDSYIDYSGVAIHLNGGELGNLVMAPQSKAPQEFEISNGYFEDFEVADNLGDFITGGTFRNHHYDAEWLFRYDLPQSIAEDWLKNKDITISPDEYCELTKEELINKNYRYCFEKYEDENGEEYYRVYEYQAEYETIDDVKKHLKEGYNASDNNDDTWTVTANQ